MKSISVNDFRTKLKDNLALVVEENKPIKVRRPQNQGGDVVIISEKNFNELVSINKKIKPMKTTIREPLESTALGTDTFILYERIFHLIAATGGILSRLAYKELNEKNKNGNVALGNKYLNEAIEIDAIKFDQENFATEKRANNIIHDLRTRLKELEAIEQNG